MSASVQVCKFECKCASVSYVYSVYVYSVLQCLQCLLCKHRMKIAKNGLGNK